MSKTIKEIVSSLPQSSRLKYMFSDGSPNDRGVLVMNAYESGLRGELGFDAQCATPDEVSAYEMGFSDYAADGTDEVPDSDGEPEGDSDPEDPGNN